MSAGVAVQRERVSTLTPRTAAFDQIAAIQKHPVAGRLIWQHFGQ